MVAVPFHERSKGVYGPAFVLDALLACPSIIHEPDDLAGQLDGTESGTGGEDMDDESILPDITVTGRTLPHPAIPSLGLW